MALGEDNQGWMAVESHFAALAIYRPHVTLAEALGKAVDIKVLGTLLQASGQKGGFAGQHINMTSTRASICIRPVYACVASAPFIPTSKHRRRETQSTSLSHGPHGRHSAGFWHVDGSQTVQQSKPLRSRESKPLHREQACKCLVIHRSASQGGICLFAACPAWQKSIACAIFQHRPAATSPPFPPHPHQPEILGKLGRAALGGRSWTSLWQATALPCEACLRRRWPAYYLQQGWWCHSLIVVVAAQKRVVVRRTTLLRGVQAEAHQSPSCKRVEV